jgi:hypothetical protein
MTSTELIYRRSAPPAVRRQATTVERLLDFEANCYAAVMRWYVFATDIAPILIKYQAKQVWRDVKYELGYLVDDLLDGRL